MNEKKIRLHLGCGRDYRKGYVNCDLSPMVNPDKIVDLEKGLPFKDNIVKEIVANHVLEHVNNFVPLMHEIYRVCENNAVIKIRVPFFAAPLAQFTDPTHVRSFTPFTFRYFKKGDFSHEVNCDKDMFDVQKVRIKFGFGRSSPLNFILDPLINFNQLFYCRFFAWILPATEIYFELRVIK